LETLLDREVAIAKELLADGKRDRALLALRRKKLQEAQLKTIDDWLINVESLLANVQLAQLQNQVFSALQEGSEVMKTMQKEVTIEQVERLREDQEAAKEYQETLLSIMGGAEDGVDEIELEAELQALMDEEAAEVLAQLPAVPTAAAAIKIQQTEEEEEGREEPMLAA
jgi:charged multivesicular body protein 6